MTALPQLTPEKLALLKALNEAKIPYMIVGMSAALLQGTPGMTRDIDLWVRDQGSPIFAEAVKKAGAFYFPPSIFINPPMPAMLLGKGLDQLDLVVMPSGLGSFDEEYQNAIDIQIDESCTVKVLPIERVITSKEAAGKLKDQMALPALKATLAVKQYLKKHDS